MAEDLEVVPVIGVQTAARSLLVAIEREIPPQWRAMLEMEMSDLRDLIKVGCSSESPNGRACVLPLDHTIRHCSARLDDEKYRERCEG